MPVFETGTLLTATKSFASAKKPSLTSLNYTLNGQSISVDVIGSPGTADEEIVTQSLDGASSYTLSWSETHADFQLEFSLSTSDDSETPVVDDVTLEVTVPAAPTGLTIDGSTEDELTLGWDAVGNATAYRVYRAQASGSTLSDYTEIAKTSSTGYTNTSLEDGERYYYRVTAVNSAGESDASAEIDATTILPAATDVTPDASVEDEISLTWTRNDDSADGGWEVYRSEDGSLGSLVATLTDPSATSYTDTGLDDGEEYYYTLRRYTDHTSADAAQQSAITVLPAPTDLALTPGTRTIDLSWTVAHDDGTQTVQYKRSSDSTWTDWASGLALSTTSETITGLLDGEAYDVRVVAVNDTTTPSAAQAATTDLPDVAAPTVDNGIEDELTASWTDVINNGDYRLQIRETEQDTWDATATGFAEQTVGEATTSATFQGLEDGEAYEIRIRTETEHTTGAWTDPVAETTAFPTPTNVSVDSTAATSATISWTDQADNEDGFRILVAEERFGTFGDAQVFRTLDPNTETVTLGLRPDTTYRVTVEAFTEDASVSQSVELTTDAPAVSTDGAARVPAQGPHLEVDHPSNGRTLTPTITGEVAPPRALNQLPTTRVPVAGEKWTSDTWIGADVRLWIDGHRQPVESLVRPVQTPEGAELELRGGEALLKRVEQSVIEQEADDFVRNLLSAEASGIAQTVDDPASTVSSDTRVLEATTTDEWTDVLPAAPFAADDPRYVTADGTLATHPVAPIVDAEDGNYSNTASTFFGDRFAGGAAAELNALADAVEISVTTGHDFPSSAAFVALRLEYLDDTHPGFEVRVDGTTIQSISADQDFTNDAMPRWFDFDIGSTLAAGSHTVTVEVTGAASDDSELFVDAFGPIDDRYVTLTDEDLTNGGQLSSPKRHPTRTTETEDADTIQQVVGGKLTTEWNSTARDQAIAISNDQGANWTEATNSTSVETDFASGSTNLRARFTQGAYDDGSDGPLQYAGGQAVDLFDLFADLDDTPILVDQVYDGTIESVITEVADFADAFWEIQWDAAAGSQSVEWTFPGQRTAEGDASLVDYQTDVDATTITEKAVVYGTSQSISDESVTLQHDTAVALEEQYNQPAQITATSSDGSTTYERGTDYTYDPQAGEVTALSTGSIADGETVLVDYDTRVRGVYSLPSWSGDETVARTRTIPAATTDRSAETAARILVQQTSEPIHSATVTIEELPVQWGLVEMVSFVELPGSETFEIYSVGQGTGTQELQLGTRDTVDQVVSDLQTRLEATASKV